MGPGSGPGLLVSPGESLIRPSRLYRALWDPLAWPGPGRGPGLARDGDRAWTLRHTPETSRDFLGPQVLLNSAVRAHEIS